MFKTVSNIKTPLKTVQNISEEAEQHLQSLPEEDAAFTKQIQSMPNAVQENILSYINGTDEFVPSALDAEIQATDALKTAPTKKAWEDALGQWRKARTNLNTLLRTSVKSCDAAGMPFINWAINANKPALTQHLKRAGFLVAKPWFLELRQRQSPMALENDDTAQLIDIMKTPGINVNALNNNGIPVIGQAWELKKYEHLVDLMLQVPYFYVDSPDELGQTLLHVAAQADSKPFCETLIAKGADLNKADRNGVTPLHIAAYRNARKAIQALLAKGADPNQADEHGQTPLHKAAAENNPGVIQLLVNNGADPYKTNNRGRTPLQVALQAGNSEAVAALKYSQNIPRKRWLVRQACTKVLQGIRSVFSPCRRALRRNDTDD